MVLTVDTNKAGSASDHFILPLNSGGTYDFLLEHGDGDVSHITTWNDPLLDHLYASSGIYNLSITGVCSHIYVNNTGDKLKLTGISQLGAVVIGSLDNAYYG